MSFFKMGSFGENEAILEGVLAPDVGVFYGFGHLLEAGSVWFWV